MSKKIKGSYLLDAVGVALVFALCQIPVPAVAEKVAAMLASAASPLALFVIGGGLYGLRIRGGMADISVIVAGKLLLFPALVVGCLWLFGADHDTGLSLIHL